MYYNDLYQKTINFAANAHKDQKMPGNNFPYVVHLSTVCMEVITCCLTDINLDIIFAMQVALLHDTIEDTETSYEDIKDNFGDNIAQGVLALTKNKNIAKEIRMQDSLDRIITQPKEVWIVKMADRITNLQEPPKEWSIEKIKNYHNEAILIYKTLNKANTTIGDRLILKIENYRKYFM